MNNWIFVVTKRKIGSQCCDPKKILEQRLEDEFWGLGAQTPNRCRLKQGDHVVFYVGGKPNMVFAATATLTGESFLLSKKEQEKYGHNSPCYHSEYGLLLENTQWLDNPREVRPLISQLNFIQDKNNWGLSFRRSIVKLDEDDFQRIVK
jgi:hypothetical protein